MAPTDPSPPDPSAPDLSPALELLGLALSLGALLLSLGAALGPWMELQSDLLEVERVELGLWTGCVVQDSVWNCKAHSSVLSLPPAFSLGRAGLLGAMVLEVGAIGVTVPGLSVVHTPKCLRAVPSVDLKRTLRLWGAGLGLVAAVMEAVPVTYAGHVIIRRFWEASVLEVAPRWDFGDGLFCGWASALIQALSAAALFTSCRRGVTVETGQRGGATGQRGVTIGQRGGVRGQRGGASQEYV